MKREVIGIAAVVVCSLLSAGCGGVAMTSDSADQEALVEFHSVRLTDVTDLVIEADGVWRARCDDLSSAKAARGKLPRAELTRWRDALRPFGSPLSIRQEPGPADRLVTTVNERVEGDDAAQVASALHRFASRACRRGKEFPSNYGDPDRPLTVQEALDFGTSEVLEVQGAVVIEDGRARLCDFLRESMPPQCGERALTVEGLDVSRLKLKRRCGVAWNSDVTLRGVVRGEVFDIRAR